MVVRPPRWVSFEQARARLQGHRALVLDPDVEEAGRVFVSLGQAGVHVRLARRFSQVLAMLPQLRPHLFLFATRLPEGDCLPLLLSLKASAIPPLRLVALSDSHGRSERRRFLGAGCEVVMNKPIDVHLFAQQLVRELHAAGEVMETAAPGS
jgi:DNA-binding response OmpR family regulator